MLHVKNKHVHASIQPPKHPQLDVCLHSSMCFQFQLSVLNFTFNASYFSLELSSAFTEKTTTGFTGCFLVLIKFLR